jgi:hypothetical protein
MKLRKLLPSPLLSSQLKSKKHCDRWRIVSFENSLCVTPDF